MQNLQTLMPVSYAPLYEAYDALATGKERERERRAGKPAMRCRDS